MSSPYTTLCRPFRTLKAQYRTKNATTFAEGIGMNARLGAFLL